MHSDLCIPKYKFIAAKNKSTPGIIIYQYILCHKFYSRKTTDQPGACKTIWAEFITCRNKCCFVMDPFLIQ